LPGGYTGINNDAYYPQVVERLQSVPGVSRVAVSTSKPAGGGGLGEGERVSSVNAPADATGIASLFTTV